MEFEMKYEIGQSVWVITSERKQEKETCPHCGGGKKFTTTPRGKPTITVRCPRCNGRGYTSKSVWIPTVAEAKIETCSFRRYESCFKAGCVETEICYGCREVKSPYVFYGGYAESDVFLTEEEALAEMARRAEDEANRQHA